MISYFTCLKEDKKLLSQIKTLKTAFLGSNQPTKGVIHKSNKTDFRKE
jgi:hypothetical protein